MVPHSRTRGGGIFLDRFGTRVTYSLALTFWSGLTALMGGEYQGARVNFSANLAGIVTPIVIGYAYQSTGSLVGPLVDIGIVALLGAVSYTFVLRDIHRLDMAD